MSKGYSCEIEIVGDTVLRRPRADGGIFPVYDLELQTRVVNALQGVPAPAPARYEDGAMVMPFVAGPIPYDFTPADRWLTSLPDDAARRRVWESTLDTVAAIHRQPLLDGLRVGLAAELDYWDEYLAWMGGAPRELLDVFAWCRTHAPLADEPGAVLLWGDVRFGNIVYDEATLAPKAVLDWDMVSVGPPEMDIAWLTALDAVGYDLTHMRVEGFGSRHETVTRFEGHLGRGLVHFEWFEVFALARASAISVRIASLEGRSGEEPTLQFARKLLAPS